jgi:large conductance mechanosensitive channel
MDKEVKIRKVVDRGGHMLKEFKEFAIKGNVLDLAIGFIIGTAFSQIVTSFVSNILMPPIGLLLNKADFASLYINLSGVPYSTLADAQKAGAATINYGLFLNALVGFFIVAFVLFLLVRWVNRLKKPTQVPAPESKPCPFCYTEIPVKATRCPHCTSQL